MTCGDTSYMKRHMCQYYSRARTKVFHNMVKSCLIKPPKSNSETDSRNAKCKQNTEEGHEIASYSTEEPPSNWIWAWCIKYFLRNASLKTQNFKENVWVIRVFATQKFSNFKAYFSAILNPKTDKKNHKVFQLLSFTRSLTDYSQFVSGAILSMRNVVC